MNRKGSVLIASVWFLSFFSIYLAGINFQSAQYALGLKRVTSQFEAKADFLSAIHFVGREILIDPEPFEDSLQDAWRGRVKLPEAWGNRLTVEVEDEEAKINLNEASKGFLSAFLKEIEGEVGPLETDPKIFVERLMKAREKKPLASFEELYLLEDMMPADLEKLRPHVTVYPAFPQVNLNTAQAPVLRALIESLPGDKSAKEELFRRIREYRHGEEGKHPQVFRSEDLLVDAFFERLHLSPSLSQWTVVYQFLFWVTTDSETYRMTLKRSTGEWAQAVIREKAERQGMEIMAWRER